MVVTLHTLYILGFNHSESVVMYSESLATLASENHMTQNPLYFFFVFARNYTYLTQSINAQHAPLLRE